jgi:hypothetical protein
MSRLARMATSVAALLLAAVATADETKEIRREMPLDPDGRVTIETYKGSVTVTAWDQPRVELLARIEADDTSWEPRSKREKKVKLTEVRIEASRDAVRIKSDYDAVKDEFRSGMFDWDDTGSLPLIHYTVRMPRGAALKLKDHKSRIDVRGLKGEVDLNSYKGVVDLQDLPGVQLTTYKGEVHARFASFERDSSFETYKGDITVELPERAGFDLDADAGRKGDFGSDFEGFTALAKSRWGDDHEERRYRGAVNGGGPALRMETYKGILRIRQR